jgi:Cu+-exporting ATPase
MVGSGLGAEHGILIRSGKIIQKMKDVTTIFFDKTGTITEGHPKVVKIQSTENLSNEELVQISASVGKESTHPLARAIVRLADEKSQNLIPTQNIKVTPGKGISALVDGKKIKMGSAEFVSTDGTKTELTTVYVSVNENLSGFFEFEDPIKRGSSVGIKKLKEKGIRCVMLTGDRRKVAEKTGKFIGVSDLHAEVSPLRKKEIVSQYQKRGDIVAMVGDGINDAPALTQADVGIAIGTGTDIAIETGDIVLVKGSLLGVVRTTILAKAIFRKIKQNLFWAFIYNIVSIPFAFLGLLHPVIAECAMALSSLLVVGNSNHLRRKQLN